MERPTGPWKTLLGDTTLGVIDVGSRGGVPDHWRGMLPWLTGYGFEPDEAACAIANARDAPHIEHVPFALSTIDGAKEFVLRSRGSSSGFYEMDDEFLEEHGSDYGEQRIQLKVARLDTFAAQRGMDAIHALKIDVEGGERDVLLGAGNALDDVQCVEVEVRFAGLGEGVPHFCDIHHIMTERGFTLFDLRTARVHPARDKTPHGYMQRFFHVQEGARAYAARLQGGDALYFREPQNDADQATWRRFIALLCAYHFFDLAVKHVETLDAAGRLDDAPAWVRAIQRLAPRPRWVERTGFMGWLLRGIPGRLGRWGYPAAWTRRRLPSQ